MTFVSSNRPDATSPNLAETDIGHTFCRSHTLCKIGVKVRGTLKPACCPPYQNPLPCIGQRAGSVISGTTCSRVRAAGQTDQGCGCGIPCLHVVLYCLRLEYKQKYPGPVSRGLRVDLPIPRFPQAPDEHLCPATKNSSHCRTPRIRIATTSVFTFRCSTSGNCVGFDRP